MEGKNSTISPLVSDAELVRLTESFYEAAANPPAWKAVCEDLQEILNVGSVNLGYIDLVEQVSSVRVSTALTDDQQTQYIETYNVLDPWFNAALIRPPGVIYDGIELVSHDELLETEFYQNFWHQFDLPVTSVGFFLLEETTAGVLAVNSKSSVREHSRDQHLLLEYTLRHLGRAMKLYQHLYKCIEQRDMSSQALSDQDIGLLICDSNCSVDYANSKALSLLGQFTQQLERGKKILAKAQLENVIAEMVHKVTSSSSKSVLQTTLLRNRQGGVVQVQVKSYQPPEMRAASNGEFSSRALVLARNLSDRNVPAEEQLTQVFGLTKSQARVAKVLALGVTYNEVADVLCVSRDTVKSHAREVYARTNSTGQADFVSLVQTMLR
ncbi:hypothetical protein A3709_05535 [Halioglobus sp. HI00S01]|uniref:helix-turn-helix transcriptional regulator n=1 Tax=Halioglobus sp. HI00S01 TaxID=1822214 RepID=UPI0007C3D112|nr:LuxR C-terminal-related transcriptional regulator [Halioglobus sp. HI00S01]KZX56560.1 hypothetical protein A3709_05535 [Halioglobus sp. HI00S01]